MTVFNLYYIPLGQLVLSSLVVSSLIGEIEGVLFDKKNKNKYARDYYKCEEYCKLKVEIDKLEKDLELSLNEFNNIILEIQKHNDQMYKVKTKYNNVKKRISGLVSDTLRVIYETYGFDTDENHQEEKQEQSGPVKKLTPPKR